MTESTLTPEQQREAEARLEGASAEGRVRCVDALAIAEALKVSPAAVGALADQLHLKISRCQLGCF